MYCSGLKPVDNRQPHDYTQRMCPNQQRAACPAYHRTFQDLFPVLVRR